MTAMVNTGGRGGGPLDRAAALFDVVALPAPGMSVSLAIAFPGSRLLELPNIPEAAMPEAGRMASGRGLDAERARLSCLGEAAELFSCCAWGDETLLEATTEEIGPTAILPETLNGFSTEQVEERAAWNRGLGDFDWRPPPRDPHRRLDWLAATDAFDGGRVFVPADFAFIGRRRSGSRNAVAIGDSNGCAAGADANAARLAALLELVERDATGRWWYGRRRRPAIDPASLPRLDPLGTWLAQRKRKTRFFDITTDIGIPVMAAASAEPDGSDVALGFAAALDGPAAALSAVTEMLQMEVSLETARLMGDTAGAWAAWRGEVSADTAPLFASETSILPSFGKDAQGHISTALDLLAARNIDVCFIDMTRAEIGVPVCRAVSAALCHYKPRFGKTRLPLPDAGDLEPAAFVEAPLLLI